jgi:predicted MPP superfamily phosphohydrolase
MFGAILIAAVTLMQVYVFWRAASVSFVRRRVSRKLLFGVGIALWVAFLLVRVNGTDDAGSMAATLEFVSMAWMAMLFLMSVALLAVEAITGFGFFFRRFGSKLRGGALVVGGLLSAIALIQGLRAPVIQAYDVHLSDLPSGLDGTVIVALSDMHLGTVLGAPWLAARVEQVRAERPDVVVLLGDVFVGHGAAGKDLLAPFRGLSAPLGVWAVLGNHESHRTTADNIAMYAEAGVHLLSNAWIELRPGLVLAGVEDLSAGREAAFVETTLAKTLVGRPRGATVLLSHAPLSANGIADKGVDLMLSGHTHGGQIWPFGYLVRQRFPLLEGRYEFGETTVLVSRGTGTWGPRMRLWCPAEILRVTLHGRTPIPFPQPALQARDSAGNISSKERSTSSLRRTAYAGQV